MRIALSFLLLSSLAACVDSASDATPSGDGDDGGDDGAECACDSPPAATCIDSDTLEAFREPGTCSGGACDYETFTTDCPFGCADGACKEEVCTPSCSTNECVSDGCGGTCGECDAGTTYPNLTPMQIGMAEEIRMAPDGVHVAAIRSYDPVDCANPWTRVGKLDVWTVPPTGAPTKRTIANGVRLQSVIFTDDGRMVFTADGDGCSYDENLWVANIDGTEARKLGTRTLLHAVRGDYVWWVETSGTPTITSYWAAKLPSGAPVLVASNPSWKHYESYAPDGRAVAIQNDETYEITIHRVDGTSTFDVTGDEDHLGYPRWSPDGTKLAYSTLIAAGTYPKKLYVINADGTGKTMLDDSPATGEGLIWSSDSSRLAWMHRPPTFGLDIRIHSFAGGQDVVLTKAIDPVIGGRMWRFEFSRDESRILFGGGGRVVTGSTTVSGPVTVLETTGEEWLEAADDTAISTFGTNTRVTMYGGGTTSISRAPFSKAAETGGAGRWLIGSTNMLGVYSKTGAVIESALPGYMWTQYIRDYAASRRIPFLVGFVGSTILYPSNVFGTGPNKIELDLVAKNGSSTGLVGEGVTRYLIDDSNQRIFFTNSTGGLFVVAQP